MISVVIDTNVLVSAYITNNLQSPPMRVLNHLLKRDIVIQYSEDIIDEYMRVLSRPHFHIDSIKVANLISFIQTSGVNLYKTPYDKSFVDEDDRKFYEVFLSKDDCYLVTGNMKHFPLNDRVVTPSSFISLIEK